MLSNKLCSEHLEQDHNVKYVDSKIRNLRNGACQSLLLWLIRSKLEGKHYFIARMIIMGMFWHQPFIALVLSMNLR